VCDGAGFLPGLILAGAGNGLTQPPLFAAAGSLPENRSTTGSAVLNMARQTGSALGVALVVAIMATDHPDAVGEFHRGWWLVAGAFTAASVAYLVYCVHPKAVTVVASNGK
jgi:hypothetical protein